MSRLSGEAYKQATKNDVVLVLDNIRSSNNIGSFFRTADALLVQSIYLCGYTATPPSKDIHKTALGAEDVVDWVYFENAKDAVMHLGEKGYTVYAVEQVENSILLHQFHPASDTKIALVFGNEVSGVQQEVINCCHGAIEIPQFGTKHSFNVSVSAGIVIWDVVSKMKLLM